VNKMLKRILCALCACAVLLAAFAQAETVIDGEKLLEVEQALYALGFHSGDSDAQLDENTRRALRCLQIANGLPVTGEPDAATLELLDGGMAVTSHEFLVSLAAKYMDQPILQLGSVGESVTWLQQTLKALGYYRGESDGVYGDATSTAVRRFQLAHGLTQTGIADRSTQIRLSEGSPLTWEAFAASAVAAMGDSGVNVRMLQQTLAEMGYFKGECSGIFGELTYNAVMEFQDQNELEPTGTADAATCALLYYGEAAALRAEGTLKLGDAGEAVASLQSRLAALGYFERDVTGIFGATTVTAVRLFQQANGLPATGEADPATQTWLENGLTLESARQSFLDQVLLMDSNARDVIGSVAMRSRGIAFEAGYEDLYEGFSFVQYVCVYAGVPVVWPEDLLYRITEQVTEPAALRPGEIIAMYFDEEDGRRMLMAIASGEGRAIYAGHDSAYVLESQLSQMGYDELCRWSSSAEAN